MGGLKSAANERPSSFFEYTIESDEKFLEHEKSKKLPFYIKNKVTQKILQIWFHVLQRFFTHRSRYLRRCKNYNLNIHLNQLSI